MIIEKPAREHRPFRKLTDAQLIRRHKRYGEFGFRVIKHARRRSMSQVITLVSRASVRIDQVVRELLRRHPG